MEWLARKERAPRVQPGVRGSTWHAAALAWCVRAPCCLVRCLAYQAGCSMHLRLCSLYSGEVPATYQLLMLQLLGTHLANQPFVAAGLLVLCTLSDV